MCPSSDAVSKCCESGEKHKLRTDIAWPSSVCATLPAATSKMLIMPSMAPLAMYFPSGLCKWNETKFSQSMKATTTKLASSLTYAMLSVNLPFCGSSTCSGFAVSALYIDILPSCDPEMTYLSHGENATVHKSTGPSAAWFSSWPVSIFQRHRPESSELLAIVLPSELTATDTTPSEWPDNFWRNSKRLSFRSQIFTMSSKLPVTMKSLTGSTEAVESLEMSGSAVTSSFFGLFGSPVWPHATLQMLSSCAFSSLCNTEYCGRNKVRTTNLELVNE